MKPIWYLWCECIRVVSWFELQKFINKPYPSIFNLFFEISDFNMSWLRLLCWLSSVFGSNIKNTRKNKEKEPFIGSCSGFQRIKTNLVIMTNRTCILWLETFSWFLLKLQNISCFCGETVPRCGFIKKCSWFRINHFNYSCVAGRNRWDYLEWIQNIYVSHLWKRKHVAIFHFMIRLLHCIACAFIF